MKENHWSGAEGELAAWLPRPVCFVFFYQFGSIENPNMMESGPDLKNPAPLN